MQAECSSPLDSTRETARPYNCAMRSPTIILLPLLFILAHGAACKDDEPTGGEFGDPCGYDAEKDENKTCGDGLECDTGYCEEKCEVDSDCQQVEGHKHICSSGLCRIPCGQTEGDCPQTLATPLECIITWCSAAS